MGAVMGDEGIEKLLVVPNNYRCEAGEFKHVKTP